MDGTYDPLMQGQVGAQTPPFDTPVSLTAPLALAVSVAPDGWSAAFNGAILSSPVVAGTVPSVTSINIGALVGGSRRWGGTIERIVIHPRRLTDTQLQEITA
jgi:hypothetical protein